jgi:hypothetical protein
VHYVRIDTNTAFAITSANWRVVTSSLRGSRRSGFVASDGTPEWLEVSEGSVRIREARRFVSYTSAALVSEAANGEM